MIVFVAGNAALSVVEGDLQLSPRLESTQDVSATVQQSSAGLGPSVSVPKPVIEVLKVVYQTKCTLIRVSSMWC